MATFIRKATTDVLREALAKLSATTPITATSPGSIARAFTEAVADQIGDLYDALDYNMAQSVISTASGTALDMLGTLYGIQRRQLTDLATTDASIGAFYFYIDTTYVSDITIPAGTRVYTSTDTFVGRQLNFVTTVDGVIPAGRTKVFVAIRPDFTNSGFTAGANTLITHNAPSPLGIVLKCTNPKQISGQPGFETDDNFRIRIQKSIRVAASGTLEAVRYAGLAVNGVRDIQIDQATFGMGTFQVMIVSELETASATTLQTVAQQLNNVRPIGVRMFLKQPTLLPIDMAITPILDTSLAVESQLNSRIVVSIRRYLNTLLPGDVLVYNGLIQAIFNTSTSIKDVQVTSFAPNGVEAIRRNYTPLTDEQIIPGQITVSLA